MSNAISFSRAALYKKCPASYEWQYVLGNRDEREPGAAASRGTLIHNSIEEYYNQIHDELHPEIPSKVGGYLREFKAHVVEKACGVMPEMPFALTEEWKACDFDAEEALLRGFMDCVFTYPEHVAIHEYKTGKEYDEHADQKQLYAAVALTIFDHVDEVEVVGVYIDQKKLVPTRYNRAHLPAMKHTWERLIDQMNTPIYPARPGFHCRWCPKSKRHNGGMCEVG